MKNNPVHEAWLASGIRATAVNYTVFRAGYLAGRATGYDAGMERAAEICDECTYAPNAADAIRAETIRNKTREADHG